MSFRLSAEAASIFEIEIDSNEGRKWRCARSLLDEQFGWDCNNIEQSDAGTGVLIPCKRRVRLWMRPLRSDDRVVATLPAAIPTEKFRLGRTYNRRIVALMALANTTGMGRNDSSRQRKRNQVSRKGKQQQKSGGRALHTFSA